MIIVSYQGNWYGQKNSHATLSTKAARITGRVVSPIGMRL